MEPIPALSVDVVRGQHLQGTVPCFFPNGIFDWLTQGDDLPVADPLAVPLAERLRRYKDNKSVSPDTVVG